PVSCAAALASLRVILETDLIKEVEKKALEFRRQLQHPAIREIRGKGLMLSIQLDTFDQVEKVSKYCADHGVIIDWFLHCDTALRIAPPLIISEAEIKTACAVILAALNLL